MAFLFCQGAQSYDGLHALLKAHGAGDVRGSIAFGVKGEHVARNAMLNIKKKPTNPTVGPILLGLVHPIKVAAEVSYALSDTPPDLDQMQCDEPLLRFIRILMKLLKLLKVKNL